MVVNCSEKIFDKLFMLESLLVTTKDSCIQKDFNNKSSNNIEISYERNNYINNLNLALTIISSIKNQLE